VRPALAIAVLLAALMGAWLVRRTKQEHARAQQEQQEETQNQQAGSSLPPELARRPVPPRFQPDSAKRLGPEGSLELIVCTKWQKGDAAAGVTVLAMQEEMQKRETGSDGCARFQHLHQGPVHLEAVPAKGASALVSLMNRLQLGGVRSDYNLTGDEESPVVTITVEEELSGPIAGRVVSPDGSPVGDAKVVAVPLRIRGVPLQMATKTIGTRDVSTTPAGEFVLKDVSGGPFTLAATAAGYAESRQENVRPGVHDLVLVLQRGGTVVGVLRDCKSQEPLADTTVHLALKGSPMGTAHMTSPQGNFEIRDVAPGVYVLSAGRGGKDGQREISVTEGQNVTAPLCLTRVALTGHVVDGEGKPASGVQVAVMGGPSVPDGVTDNEGRFTLGPLPRARHIRIRATPPTLGSRASIVEANLQDDGHDVGEIRLDTGTAAAADRL
jgi:hypothetical protein